MKTIGQVLLVAAVAAMAVSFSSPSYAAKKKAAAACTPGAWQAGACVGAWRTGSRCWADGKWYPSFVGYPDATCLKK